MKKPIVMLLVLTMIPVFAACARTDASNETQASSAASSAAQTETAVAATEPTVTVDYMDYTEFMASPLDAEVTIETYVQASERWWDGKVTLYCQSPAGGYYLYNLACTEEEAAKFVPGIKVRATGIKAQWNGNTEIIDGTVSVAEVENGYVAYIAEAADVTALLGTDALAAQTNRLGAFKGMTVAPSTDADGKEASFLYKEDGTGEQGDDIYFTLTDGTNTIRCRINVHMLGCDADSEIYKVAEALKLDDKVDAEGFLFWNNTVNVHITSLTAGK